MKLLEPGKDRMTMQNCRNARPKKAGSGLCSRALRDSIYARRGLV